MDLKSIYNENILVDINNLNIFLKEKRGGVDDYLLIELKNKIGNKCNKDGLVKKNSIEIIFRNCGEFIFNERILYKIKFSADILYPTEGCLLENCKIIFISKVLYIAKPENIDLIVLLPKKFIENSLSLKNKINVVCLDKYYELTDKYMFIIGIPHFNNPTQEFILSDLKDDNICKNILEDFQKNDEYQWLNERLFRDKLEEVEETIDIDYNLNSSIRKPQKTNLILIKLREDVDTLLKDSKKCISYQVNTSTLNTYEDLFNIIELIDNGISLYTEPIYLNYKNELINNDLFDYEQYNNILSQVYNLDFIENKNKVGITNQSKECYIISSIYILQNCKIFRKKINNLVRNGEGAQPYQELLFELDGLLNEKIKNIDRFKELLNIRIEGDEYINFNLSNLQNIYDFINILFYFIDKNRINNVKTYKHYVYSDIINVKSFTEINNTHSISHYIEELTKNHDDLLREFYSVVVNEYSCSECQFRYYHIKNKFTLNMDINKNNTIANCIHNSGKVPTDINGLKCQICEAVSISRLSYFYKNPHEYLLFDINRIIFETGNSIKKNQQELFVNNRVHFKMINKTNSINSLTFDNYILDLKSIICHIGTVSNGHYITLNKNKNNMFELHIDEKNYIIRSADFYDLSLFKKNVSNVVYQINNIDNPMSDIHLLLYEEHYNNVNEPETFENFIKNEVGIKVSGKLLGGSSLPQIEQTQNPLEKLFYSRLITQKMDLINIINNYYETIHIIISGNETESELILKINTFWLQNMRLINNSIHMFYNEIIINYIKNLKKEITLENQIIFLESNPTVDFLYDINKIYIGSTGYNRNETNHWDVIYGVNDNQLDLYSKHFNSIEINDTYYNKEDEINWTTVKNNIEQLNNDKFKLSIVFNNNFINKIINTSMSELEGIIESEFNNYWSNRIDLVSDSTENIVFIFNSNFEYNQENFNKIKLLNNKILDSYKDTINFVFEIYNNDWYNEKVSNYFISEDLAYVTLIVNNDNSDFGYNFDPIQSLEFINGKEFNISYIKLYGSESKYNGNHSSDLYKIIKKIRDDDIKENKKFISEIKPSKNHFIYFNNLETDFNNIRYTKKYSDSTDETLKLIEEDTISDKENEDEENKDEDENEGENEDEEKYKLQDSDLLDEETTSSNINMPSSVFDAKCLYNILEKINNN